MNRRADANVAAAARDDQAQTSLGDAPSSSAGGAGPATGHEGSRAALRYTVLGEFARGGLGRVFSATDDALGRTVAIKQLLVPTADARARFEREAKITARLQHSGVVPVYDAGQWDNGEAFFVMKMVEGRTLADLIQDKPAAPDRLALLPRVLAVAETVAYAHGQGVIHRDLKPSNVVISPYGETVVIDWGLARVLCDRDDAGDGDAANLNLDLQDGPTGLAMTAVGQVLGTPQFMPSEQAAGETVDERADVYALGAILYNVLGGCQPYADTPQPQLVEHVRTHPPRPLGELVADLPGDLAAIVDKAMARARGDRYASARELAQDLRRFLDGQLVTAHRYSPWALVARWLRRHRAAVTVAAVLVTALVAGGIVSVRRVVHERNAALRAQQEVERRENALVFLQADRSLADDPTATLAWLKRYRPPPLEEWRGRALADEAVALGAARHVISFDSPSRTMRLAPDLPIMAVGNSDGAVRLYDLDTGASTELGRHGTPVIALAFSPAGGRLAAVDRAGTLRLWDVANRRLIDETKVGRANAPNLVFSADGRQLAAAGSGRAVWLLSVDDPRDRQVIELAAPTSSLCFLRDGALASSDVRGGMAVFEKGASIPHVLAGLHPDARLSCLSDGRFVSAGTDGLVRLWDQRKGEVRSLGQHNDWISTIAPSPDGAWIATGGGDDTVRLFGLAGQKPRLLGRHGDTVMELAFAERGRLLATADRESIDVWDVKSGELVRHFRSGHTGWEHVGISNDGRWLVASGLKEARIWPMDMLRSQTLRGHTDLVVALEWSPSGRRLASGARDRTVRVWDPEGGPPWTSARLDSWVMIVSFLDEEHLFVVTRTGSTLVYDLSTHEARTILPAGAGNPTLSSNGKRVAFADGRGVVIEDLDTHRQLRLAVEAQITDVADINFSADDRRVGLAMTTGVVGVWATDTGRPVNEHRLGDRINQIALASDGRWAAVMNAHNQASLWDLTLDRFVPVPGTEGTIVPLDFTNDQRTLMYHRGDQIGFYDLATKSTQTLLGHRAEISEVVKANRGALLASADHNGFVRLWNADTGANTVVYREEGSLEGLQISPDNQRLATSGPDASLRVWNLAAVHLTKAAPDERARLNALTTAAIDNGQTLRSP